MVKVGFEIPPVGKTEEPATYRLPTPCTFRFGSTTPSFGLVDIRVVPMWWPLTIHFLDICSQVGYEIASAGLDIGLEFLAILLICPAVRIGEAPVNFRLLLTKDRIAGTVIV
jgi:hypothetical protein